MLCLSDDLSKFIKYGRDGIVIKVICVLSLYVTTSCFYPYAKLNPAKRRGKIVVTGLRR